MLAKRIPTILPDMTFEEALETTKIYSVAGMLPNDCGIMESRPFRAPHHTMSSVALTGGGTVPMPGEVSFSHNGVLFLDELPEFNKLVTETLRQPLEDGQITISRAGGRYTFPARFMLVCAMNPCKCGYYGHRTKKCTCSESDRKKYLSKISGPLLDRIDIQIEVPSLSYREISAGKAAESSADIRARVVKTREYMKERCAQTDKKLLEYAPASNVSLIVCTAPVWTAVVMSLFYRGERMSRRQIAGSALAFAGMVLVVLNGHFVLRLSPRGDMLALSAAMLWMVYSLVIKRLGGRYPAIFITRKVFFYGLVTILPVFAFRPFGADWEVLSRPVVWGNLLFLGVVASMLCYVLWNAAMHRLGAVRTTNYIYFNPLVTIVAATLCIGERITLAALAGAALILYGMWRAKRA